MTFAKLLPCLSLALVAGLSLSACDRTIDSLESTPTGRSCELVGEAQSCGEDDGVAYCGQMDSGSALEYGPCIAPEELECEPGDFKHVAAPPSKNQDEDDFGDPCSGTDYSCELIGGVPMWQIVECNTPLVLRFDQRPVELIPAEATPAATFDINMREGSCLSTDWPSAATPWLVVDLDGNGSIDGGHELFGSGTRLASGARAAHGFAALAEFDHDRNGYVDADDPRFAEIMVWRDWDADRRSTPDELEPLAQTGVTRLAVDHRNQTECDERGNCGVWRAGFEHHGGVGEIVDLYLACQ
jgi:hypothetical protein